MNVLPAFSIIDGLCIIARSSLEKYPQISQRLHTLSSQSNGEGNTISSVCPVQQLTCRSYVALSLATNIEQMDLPTINGIVEVIQGMLAYVIYPKKKELEIYEICVDPKSQKDQVRKKLLTTILKLNRDSSMWISYRPENPSSRELLSLYTQLGFRRPYITNKTLSGKILNYEVIGLIYQKGLKESVPGSEIAQTIQQGDKIMKNYHQTVGSCRTNIFIEDKVCRELEAYIEKDREYAGILAIKEYITMNTQKYASLYYPRETERQGEGAPNYIVAPPISFFTFHTHPTVCYDDANAEGFAGWPSGKDMRGQVEDYNLGLRKHFIPSLEGIYALSLTTDFATYWIGLPEGEERKNVLTGIEDIFGWLEKNRTTKILQEKMILNGENEIVKQGIRLMLDFLKLANNYTLTNLGVKNKKEFVLFRVIFKTWEDIYKQGGFLDIVDYLPGQKQCEIPE